MPTVIPEQQQWHDSTTGKLLVDGKVYIGEVGLDPTVLANQLTLFSERSLTNGILNPQATDSNGQTEQKIWFAESKYSIAVTDSADVVKYLELDNGSTDALVGQIGANVPVSPALGVANGNFFNVTAGTGPISSIDSLNIGTLMWLTMSTDAQFIHSPDIILPGETNLDAKEGDILQFREYNTGQYQLQSI
jgi:hypothetical protein